MINAQNIMTIVLTDHWVIVQEVVQILSAVHERTNDFARMHCFHCIAYCRAVDEFENAVGEHLRMHAQIPMQR